MSKQNGNKGRRFDRAFKEEAVRLLQTSGRRQRQIAGDLGISVSALGRWVAELRAEDLLSGPRRRSRAQGPAGGAGHDRALEGGREDATGARRDHHRDGVKRRGSGVQMWGWRAMGIFTDRRQKG